MNTPTPKNFLKVNSGFILVEEIKSFIALPACAGHYGVTHKDRVVIRHGQSKYEYSLIEEYESPQEAEDRIQEIALQIYNSSVN